MSATRRTGKYENIHTHSSVPFFSHLPRDVFGSLSFPIKSGAQKGPSKIQSKSESRAEVFICVFIRAKSTTHNSFYASHTPIIHTPHAQAINVGVCVCVCMCVINRVLVRGYIIIIMSSTSHITR